METYAIIGPTASGKSDLAVRIAEALDAEILSLDSLSIYKQIDIASAKPTPGECRGILHYGIDLLAPDEAFSVATFIDLYRDAKAASESHGKPLVIVGGSSFYLKALIEGISEVPPPDGETLHRAETLLRDLKSTHAMLSKIDPQTMRKIAPADRYRIEKMLLLYLQSGAAPSEWFAAHPPQPVLTDFTLYEIAMARDVLRERIRVRTGKMVDAGLIDEVAGLERRYGRAPNAMKAIGIVEVLDFLDGKCTKAEMTEQITTHTAQLAKRQQTFNRNQFPMKKSLGAEEIYTALIANR